MDLSKLFWVPCFNWKGPRNSCLSVRACVGLKPMLLGIDTLFFFLKKIGAVILRIELTGKNRNFEENAVLPKYRQNGSQMG